MDKTYKIFIASLFLSVIGLLFSFFIVPDHAFAIIENYDQLPLFTVRTAFFKNPKCENPEAGNRVEGGAQFVWLSPGAQPTVESAITLAPNQDSVDLWINTASAVCNSNIDDGGNIINKELLASKSTTISYSTTVGSMTLITPSVTLNQTCVNAYNLRWTKICGQGGWDVFPEHQDMRLSGLSSLPAGTHNITVTVIQRMIHWIKQGNDLKFRCVAQVNGAIVPASSLDDPNCRAVPISRTITITIPPRPDPKHYNLQPAEPAIDQANGTVTFNINNLGDGDARFRYDNAGTYVLYNSAYYASIWVNNKLIQPDSNFNNTFQGRPITAINPHGTWTTSYGLKKGIDYHDGDQICALLATDPSEGETDGVITVGRRESNNGTKTCIIASSKPYFRVYGGDVVVGRQFPNPASNCTKQLDSKILAFTNSSSGGAGTQFAASATGKIEDFMSASMRNDTTTPSVTYGVPKPPNGLSFLNTGNPSSVPIGNDDSAYRGCVPDYDAYVNSDGGYATNPPGTITSVTDLNSNKLYINGDLNITGDIEDTSLPWSKIEDIKPIIVIVKGNINIAPNVTRLDGLYVAMPSGKDPNTGEILGGVINTCEPINTSCNSQLVIKGAFVAKQVKLMRLKGDVSSTIPPNEQNNSTNIAEIFNFPTELYLGLKYQNIAPTTPNATRKDYDTIVGLPPIL